MLSGKLISSSSGKRSTTVGLSATSSEGLLPPGVHWEVRRRWGNEWQLRRLVRFIDTCVVCDP